MRGIYIKGNDSPIVQNTVHTYVLEDDPEILENYIGEIIARLDDKEKIKELVKSLEQPYSVFEHSVYLPENSLPDENEEIWRDAIKEVFGEKVCIASVPEDNEYARSGWGYNVLHIPEKWVDFFKWILPTSTDVVNGIDYETREPTPEEMRVLEKAKNMVGKLFEDFPEILVSDNIRGGGDEEGVFVLGCYNFDKDHIVLNAGLFSNLPVLTKVLLHEMVHRQTQAGDCTKEFTQLLENQVTALLFKLTETDINI